MCCGWGYAATNASYLPSPPPQCCTIGLTGAYGSRLGSVRALLARGEASASVCCHSLTITTPPTRRIDQMRIGEGWKRLNDVSADMGGRDCHRLREEAEGGQVTTSSCTTTLAHCRYAHIRPTLTYGARARAHATHARTQRTQHTQHTHATHAQRNTHTHTTQHSRRIGTEFANRCTCLDRTRRSTRVRCR